MAFDDSEFQSQWEQQRAAAEHRQSRISDLLQRAAVAEGAGEFVSAAEWYEQAARLVVLHERDIFRTRASQMRRLAKNGGDYAALRA